MSDETPETDLTPTDPAEPQHQVEVRRNVVLSGAVGAVAAVLTAAFAVRAFGDGAVLDWVAFGVLGLIAIVHLAALADGRAPLMVADGLGVRLRHGAQWRGVAWTGVECLEHLPRRRPLRDGHLLVVGHDGQQLIVPLTLATRVVGADRATLSDELAELADGRADVVEVVPGLADDEELPEAADVDGYPPPTGDAEDTVRLEPRGIAAAVEAKYRSSLDEGDDARSDDRGDDRGYGAVDMADTVDTIAPVAAEASTDEIEAVRAPLAEAPVDTTPGPGRPVVAPARVEVQRAATVHGTVRPGHETGSHPTMGANALHAGPDDFADPARLADPEAHALTVVLDDLALHPAAAPVIGPQLEAARDRLRLTVDQLSERTRIRPHVIEAIEVDDFGPCGGDFYARGHLRTLARVLGVEAAPLITAYDETYAAAPVDPRRVFESELATGVGGSIRGTRGGRNWSVLVAAVMAAVLIWSIAQLVMDGPVPIGDTPVLNQSGGISNGNAGKAAAVPVTLTAAGGGARLVVRDGGGDVVFDGPLAFGQTSELKIVPPVRIWSSDGSVTAAVDGDAAVPLGKTGEEVTTTIPAP